MKTAGLISTTRRLAFAAAAAFAPATAVTAAEPAIQLELNNAVPVKDGCRVSFVMRNDLTKRITELKLEIVLFDRKGSVSRFLVLNAGSLPAGKTKVRQFDLGNQKCDGISRVLLNDVTQCKGDSLSPAACLDMIVPATAASISLIK